MLYDVPFSSQYEGVTDPAWQYRGCGIVALKMVFDYWHGLDARCATAPIGELLSVGRSMGAYREGIGWIHSGLANIAKRYGYVSFNVDYAERGPTPKSADEALQALADELERGPVLASVYSGLEPERGGGHIIVVTGFDSKLVAFNDPEETGAREGKKLIVLSRFLLAYKRRAIIVCAGDGIRTRDPFLDKEVL